MRRLREEGQAFVAGQILLAGREQAALGAHDQWPVLTAPHALEVFYNVRLTSEEIRLMIRAWFGSNRINVWRQRR